MPLARIDLAEGKAADYRRTIGEVVYDALVEVSKENWSFGNGEAQYAK